MRLSGLTVRLPTAPICGGEILFQAAYTGRVQNSSCVSFTGPWRSQNKHSMIVYLAELSWPRRDGQTDRRGHYWQADGVPTLVQIKPNGWKETSINWSTRTSTLLHWSWARIRRPGESYTELDFRATIYIANVPRHGQHAVKQCVPKRQQHMDFNTWLTCSHTPPVHNLG